MYSSEMKELGFSKAALALVHDKEPERFCSSRGSAVWPCLPEKRASPRKDFIYLKVLKYAIET